MNHGIDTYKDFVETLGSDNTKKVARSLSRLGEYDYDNCTPIDIQSIILSMKPNSLKAITTITYMLSLYAKYLCDDDMLNIVQDIDRNVLWSIAKPAAKKKFISNSMFLNAYKNIGVYEDYNGFYLQTLFRCIYEGIYNDDMSVLKNLRGSDVKEYELVAPYESPDGKSMRQHSCRFLRQQNRLFREHDEFPNGKFLDGKFSYDETNESSDGKFMCRHDNRVLYDEHNELPDGKNNENQIRYVNIVTLKEDDGNEYELLISNGLAEDLKKLAELDVWERRNRFGTCRIKTTGLYEDSCFKVEKRKDSSEYSYRYNYYRMLRKISKEYLEYNILPLQLYISGIMHRIGIDLSKHGIDLEDAFSNRNKNRTVNRIISEELKRCNCDTEVKNFREMVIGHLESFI